MNGTNRGVIAGLTMLQRTTFHEAIHMNVPYCKIRHPCYSS